MKRGSMFRKLGGHSRQPQAAFTLIELLTVMTIIVILAGLVLAGVSYAQKKAALSRAQGEISALSTALESYKTDNGDYPRSKPSGSALGNGLEANKLDPRTQGNPANYKDASLALYAALSGDLPLNGSAGYTDTGTNTKYKVYMEFSPNMLYPKGIGQGTNPSVQYLQDPFGNPYGYSTAQNYQIQQGTPSPPNQGYNPTFDLWSTSGETTNPSPGKAGDITLKWIKNW